jgi:hypothetical protein
MKRFLLSLICLITLISTYKAQNFHEIGIDFSVMRTWEVSAPEPNYLMQDLDFSYFPNITYQFYFLDEKLTVGASIGLLREIGEKESISQERERYRKDLRNSLAYQITGSANLFRSKVRFFQISTGIRVMRSYFFSHYDKITEVTESGSFRSSGGFELDKWSDPRYSFLLSVGYQRSLFGKLNDKTSLSWRLTWDFIYQFPTFYGTVQGIENRYASIYTGPSVSLIWRIKQSRNRGLF